MVACGNQGLLAQSGESDQLARGIPGQVESCHAAKRATILGMGAKIVKQRIMHKSNRRRCADTWQGSTVGSTTG